MESYCNCRRLGQIAISEDDFGLVFTYEATNCNFFRWRDKERVNERSRFILTKLVNRIKELEEKYERVNMQLEQLDNSNIEQSKQEKIPLDKGESLQNRYENLNINQRRRVVM
uniref:Non-LTR retroelement reverse transcriptase n=1 Tax=Solanum tuberosum TaxID=4113 RepID=M1CNL2_SOLTU